MLVLILGLVIIAFIVFLVLRLKYPSKSDYEFDAHVFFTFMSWVSGFVIVALIVTICTLAPEVAIESAIDNKIAMYQEKYKY